MAQRTTKPISLQVSPEVVEALRDHAKRKKLTIREAFEESIRATIPVKKPRPKN